MLNNYETQNIFCGRQVNEENFQKVKSFVEGQKVIKKRLSYGNPAIDVDAYATVYEDNQSNPLGVVGERYTVIQNKEIFEMLENLKSQGLNFEWHGINQYNATFGLSVKLPETVINGEKVNNYFILRHSHDGRKSLTACVTPIRMICFNMLNLAFKNAEQTWSIMHTKSSSKKIENLENSIKNIDTYNKLFANEMANLKEQKIHDDDILNSLSTIYELKETPEDAEIKQINSIDRFNERQQEKKANVMYLYHNKPDLKEHIGTKFGAVNAMADWLTHSLPQKKTQNWQQNKFHNITENNSILNKFYESIKVV